MRSITVTIRRSRENGESYLQDYVVTVPEGEIVSVMNLLEDIYNEQDASLAFFSHAACRQAACGRCTVKVDGKPRLACKERVVSDHITLEPYSNHVVRDLLCR